MLLFCFCTDYYIITDTLYILFIEWEDRWGTLVPGKNIPIYWTWGSYGVCEKADLIQDPGLG